MKIAFVCLGNICRSPTAEAIMKEILKRENIGDIEVESFGTSSWHVGSLPDYRAIEEGKKRGVKLTSRASVLTKAIADELDMILVMDSSNYQDVIEIIQNEKPDRVRYLGSFETGADFNSEISDTYYGTQEGFALAFERISRCCEGLIRTLNKH